MALEEEGVKRHKPRQSVLQKGQLVFHDSIIDCVVLDISAEGARVRTAVVVQLPDQVTLRVRGGAVLPAAQRWARGTEIGLAFAGQLSLTDERKAEARMIGKTLHEDGLTEALRRLRAANFFDDPELRQAAEEAEAAKDRLDAALQARGRRRL
jgi:PilZ domain